MTWKKATKIVILLVVAAAIVYDIAAYREGGVESTISRIALAWAHRWPVIPFSAGVLMGHLWWPQPQAPRE